MKNIIEHAKKAYYNSYSPYSKFGVGAAILMKDGKIIQGTNVENASFGLTNCAERSALFTAISLGYKKEDIEKMVIIANTKRPISPCGACRQVMQELMPQECDVILMNLEEDQKTLKIHQLLPYSFDKGDLNNG